MTKSRRRHGNSTSSTTHARSGNQPNKLQLHQALCQLHRQPALCLQQQQALRDAHAQLQASSSNMDLQLGMLRMGMLQTHML